ncbi:SDR family oxidoreductase [Candidatus Pelagibacter sp.]|nr:SDR family oxidoreductase [Candidatus Pelagibacter sp.]
MSQLPGKVSSKILITGSSSFVGTALIKELCKNHHILCIDKKINKKINLPNVKYFSSDVMNEKKLISIKNQIEKKEKKIDIIINCFVDQNYLPFEKQTLKKFKNSITTNICGTFLITKTFYSLLKKSKDPQIINFGSIYGLVSGDLKIYPNQKVTSDAYAASKAAIIQLTKYYAVNLNKYNIRVNCISPGGIFNNQNAKLIKNYIKKVPLKRMANINEIVGSVKLLLNNKSRYINGHNLIVDGGYTIL